MDKLTWECEFCFKERPDKKIAVLTVPIHNVPNAQRNLKYCNDNFDCEIKARKKSISVMMGREM